MKRFITLSLVCAIVGRAEARTIRRLCVARVAADRYESPRGDVIVTKGCTNTARWEPVILDENGPLSVVYFLDKHDEVEGECHVTEVRRATR